MGTTIDFKETLRSWRRRPFAALVAVCILGLGIGATSGLFSLLSAVFIRPLPWPHAERLVSVYGVYDPAAASPGYRRDFERGAISWPLWNDLRDHPLFEEVGVWFRTDTISWTIGNGRDVAEVWFASSQFLGLLGAKVEIGRLFAPEDDIAASPRVLLSRQAWRKYFGSDPQILGTTVVVGQIGRQSYTGYVSGVLSDELEFDGFAPDVVLPLGLRGELSSSEAPAHFAVAKLRGDINLGVAAASVNGLVTKRAWSSGLRRLRLVGLREDLARDSSSTIWALFGGALLLMVIAASNAGILLTGESLALIRDLRTRVSLGASSTQALRRYLLEFALLGAASATLGTAIAFSAAPFLVSLVPAAMGRFTVPTVDVRVVIFSIGIGLLAAVPSLATVCSALYTANRTNGTLRSPQLIPFGRKSMVLGITIQIALAVVLVVAALLFVRLLLAAKQDSIGFEPHGVTVVSTAAADAAGLRRLRQSPRGATGSVSSYDLPTLLDRLQAMPGIESVSGLSRPGVFGAADLGVNVVADSSPRVLSVAMRVVHHRFFETMRIPMRSGRGFLPQDRNGEPVVVVSEDFARQTWPASAVGRTLKPQLPDGSVSPDFLVVGVAGNVKLRDLEQRAEPVVYFVDQRGQVNHIVIRTEATGLHDQGMIARTLAEVAPSVIVTGSSTLEELLRRSLEQQRFRAWVLATYAVGALALAIAGVGAEARQQVRRQLRTVAIAQALGARRSQVIKLLAQHLVYGVFAGLAGGVFGSLVVVAVFRSIVSQSTGPVAGVIACCAGLVGVSCLVMMIVPIFRASGREMFQSLRE